MHREFKYTLRTFQTIPFHTNEREEELKEMIYKVDFFNDLVNVLPALTLCFEILTSPHNKHPW